MRRVAAIIAISVSFPAVGPAASIGSPSVRPAHRTGWAQVHLTSASRRIPRSFLGLSVEVSELPTYAQAGAAVDRVLAQLRSGSAEPLLLRVGGKSADEAYWMVPPLDVPRGVVALDDRWVSGLAELARRNQLDVTVNVNLAVHSPAMAASFATAVSRALGSSLVGLAIGNEPNLYRHQPHLEQERIASTLPSTPQHWTDTYSPARYGSDFRAYAPVLAQALPHVPVLGPETTNLWRGWRHMLTGLGASRPRSLTVHHYPFSSCWARDSPFYPRLSSLLAEPASAGLARALRAAIRFARRSGSRLVVSELNSMSCGGTPGVADSFATALWAPDALFELVRAGVAGVNWHIRPHKLNAPFEVHGRRIEPRPELYGLALFARMMRSDARLVRTRISSGRGFRLKAWAVRSRKQEAVLMINKGRRTAHVSVSGVRPGGRARLQRLVAPALSGAHAVTLAGRRIGADGRWHGHGVDIAVARRADGYRVVVPRWSAALLLHDRSELSFTR